MFITQIKARIRVCLVRITGVIHRLMIYLFRKLPVDRKLIIFESEPDLSDNAYALFDYMRKKRLCEKYKIVWLVDNPKKANKKKLENVTFVKKFPVFVTFRLCKYISTFSLYIYDHCNVVQNKREGQKIIYLSHGGILKAAKGLNHGYKENDEYYVTGSAFIDGMKNWTGSTEERIFDFGFPRLDYLINFDSERDKKIFELLSLNKYKCVYVWMPTYRKSVSKDLSENYNIGNTGLPILYENSDLDEFNSLLKSIDSICLFKTHHLQSKYELGKKKYTNIVFMDDTFLYENDIQLYEVLRNTDVLITDYSSVGFDYMITKKPIIYTLDDYEMYSDNRGFIKDPKTLMAGYTCKTKKELFDTLKFSVNKVNPFLSRREELLPILHTHCDGKASERITEHLCL